MQTLPALLVGVWLRKASGNVLCVALQQLPTLPDLLLRKASQQSWQSLHSQTNWLKAKKVAESRRTTISFSY